MKILVTFIPILLGIMTFAQSNSSFELAYDFAPSKLVHYNLSKPGSFDTKYRQPYSYIGTLKYNQGFKKNTIGLGVRGFWLNGNEKSIGAQFDYYRDLQFEQPVKLSFGLSTIWDGYRFEDNQLRSQIKIDMHSLKIVPNVKLLYQLKETNWHIKASGGLGIGFSSSEYLKIPQWRWEYELVDEQNLWSNPYLAAYIGLGIARSL